MGLMKLMEKQRICDIDNGGTWSDWQSSAVYTLAPGMIRQIISVQKSTTEYFYHYDAIGNVLMISDLSGNTVASYLQEGFGNVVSTNGDADNNYHLTTKEMDPDTGLYYFNARWYDQEVGRFVSYDPYAHKNTTSGNCNKCNSTFIYNENPYAYVLNSPLSRIDPMGLNTSCPDTCGRYKSCWGLGKVACWCCKKSSDFVCKWFDHESCCLSDFVCCTEKHPMEDPAWSGYWQICHLAYVKCKAKL